MKFTARELCRISVFVVVSAVMAQIIVPLPFTPVPISLGLMAVFVTGVFLPPRDAFFAQICYLTLGAMGLPVFARMSGGLGILIGPTGGYLLAYPIMALIASSALVRRGLTTRGAVLLSLGSMTAALFVCYAMGTAWLMFLMNLPLSRALAFAVYPFIPLDLLKIAFTSFAVLPLRGRVLQMVPSSGSDKLGA